MSVLARDIDAYQRAVEAYQRQVRGHNSTVANYNNTFFTDANGNMYAVDTSGNTYSVDPATGALTYASLPDNRAVADFGITSAGDNSPYYMLRQNPTTASTQTFTDVRASYPNANDFGQGQPVYYVLNADGSQTPLPVNYRITGTQQVPTGNLDGDGKPILEDRYTAEANTSTYAARPGEFTRTAPTNRPDPTAAQLRKLNQPGLAEQERTGLIANEIITGNVLGGGRVRGGSSTEPPPEPAPPEVPYDPWNINNPMIP